MGLRLHEGRGGGVRIISESIIIYNILYSSGLAAVYIILAHTIYTVMGDIIGGGAAGSEGEA